MEIMEMEKYQKKTLKAFYDINNWTSFLTFIQKTCEGDMVIRRWRIGTKDEFKNPFNYQFKKYPVSGMILGSIIVLHLWRGSEYERGRTIEGEKLKSSVVDWVNEQFADEIKVKKN
jgi:hypothetical protein